MNQLALAGVEPEIAIDRDAWCTPSWVWEIPLRSCGISRYDLDPCSNDYSTVPTVDQIKPPADGLSWRWTTDPHVRFVWMNPPFSDVGPWFDKAVAAARAGAHVWGVVPHAPAIEAWKRAGPAEAWSLGRVSFEPPPGVKPSSPAQEHDLVLWSQRKGPQSIRREERVEYHLERLKPWA